MTIIKGQYDNLQKEYLIDLMTPHSKFQKNKKTQEYTREYYRNYGRGDKQAKDEYVNNKLLENAEEIEELEREHIKNLITTMPKDITSAEAWIVDPRNLTDDVIQVAVKLLDQADYDAMLKFIDKRNEALSIHEELKAYRNGESDQKKLNEGIIEKIDGKETGYMVGKYLSTFSEDVSKFWEKYKDKKPTKKDFSNDYPVIDNYINPQWKALKKLDLNNPVRKTYDYLSEIAAEKDSMVPDSYKLSLRHVKEKLVGVGSRQEGIINSITYKLPSIEKDTIERLTEQGLITSTIEGTRDLFAKDSMYTESGENGVEETDSNLKKVLVDEQGKENQSIPIHYRGKIRKESQQSFDLLSISLMDYNMVVNYDEKTKVSHSLNILKDFASERTVQHRKGGKALLNALGSSDKSLVEKRGIESNSYKALNSIIQDRLYGISTVDAGDFKVFGKSVSWNKFANTIMGWTGNTMLMLNTTAGAVNLLQGKFQNFLEGATGDMYDRKDLRAAESLYIKDSANIFGDVGKIAPESLTNLLAERYNAFADFHGLSNKLANDNVAKVLYSKGVGHFINNSAEHYIQSTVMYAVLNKIKVKDSQGKYIPLHQAYEVVDKKLKLKEGIELEKGFEFDISRKIKEIIKQLHGNYDKDNQSQSQRYITGKFAFMLRKWMVVGTQRRWKGIRNATKKDRSDDDIAFNSILEKDMEGYYTTTIRFLSQQREFLKTMKFSILAGNWNELTDEERGNIQKTIVDASVMALSLSAAALFAGLAEDADDEDKNLYYTLAYVNRRFYSEIQFYSYPPEILKILSSPSASISMIDNFFKFTDQLMDPTERYVRGDRKGELKIKRAASKLFPVASQLDRQIEDTYKWLIR
jgi:hypothetical protein